MSHLRFILCAISVVILFAISLGIAAEPNKANRTDLLTPEEQKWLSEHTAPIRIGITEIPPQVLRGETDGDYKGLSIDYIRLVERYLNCKFELVYYTTWEEVMQAARNNDIDMIFAAQKTQERSEYLLFSTPYIELPNLIVVRKNMEGAFTLDKMTGLKIVCSEGSAVHEFLRANYGYLNIYPVEDELSGLIKVSFGEADAMVVEPSRASYDIEKAKITNLRVAGNTGFTYQLRFASRKDWPVLNRILDKGLSSITDEDRDAITRKWIAIGTEPIVLGRRFWGVVSAGLLAMALILLGIISWNRTLKARVTRRTRLLQQELLERRRAQEALRESEQRLSQIIDFLPDATFAIDLNGKVIAWNQAIEEMTGIKTEQMLGRGNYEYALPFYGIRRPILIDLVFTSDEEIKNKYHFVNKEGDVLLAEADVPVKGEESRTLWGKARPLYDSVGNIVGAIEAMRDITERKRAEGEIKQTNSYLENILDNSPDAIGIVDNHGRFIRWNKMAEALYGYTFEEMKSGSAFELYADKVELENMLVSLRRDGSVKKLEMRMERKDGSIVPFEISIGLLKDAQNGVLGSVGVARDLSGIKEHWPPPKLLTNGCIGKSPNANRQRKQLNSSGAGTNSF